MTPIISPVTKTNKIRLVASFDPKKLIGDYSSLFNIDVSRFFENTESVDLYECLESGLQFFYPHTVVGDGKFYESIQHFDWYYPDSKWEFRQGLSLIDPGSRVLEIGSGRGYFLQLLQSKTAHAEGLELNESAIEKIRAAGMKVHHMKIEEFEQTLTPDQKFDIVCSFQVYEHIDNIGDVIQSSINLLRPGGKLIISVPNNQCVYNDISLNPFNMPPHHQGLWYPQTFSNLQQVFNITLKGVFYEPTSFINKFRAARVHQQIQENAGTASSFQYLRSLAHLFRHKELQRGRTMLAIYEKK